MSKPIKIMHIDPEYKVTCFISQPEGSVQKQISIQQAIDLLKKEKIDLILSEPHSRAILTPQEEPGKIDPTFVKGKF